MKIGIDISQLAYRNTGVANYLSSLVSAMIEQESEHEFILFFSSMRRKIPDSRFKLRDKSRKITFKQFKFPPSFLDILWNKFHIIPIEWFIGDVDIFISSDWTQPPSKAKKATILYDVIVYKYPEETAKKIISTQKRKLNWVRKECDKILCISEATKKDAEEILGIESQKLAVIYPGLF